MLGKTWQLFGLL